MSSLGVLPLVATFIGRWEIFLIFSVVLVLFGAKRLPVLGRGLGQGFLAFRDALDDEAHGAGKSIGGIKGKPAAEALSPDNQVAELYDPEALRRDRHNHWWRRFVRQCIQSLRRLFKI